MFLSAFPYSVPWDMLDWFFIPRSTLASFCLGALFFFFSPLILLLLHKLMLISHFLMLQILASSFLKPFLKIVAKYMYEIYHFNYF